MSGAQETGKLIPYLTEMFRLQAWVALGKVANPATGKVERELPMARAMIDLLVELDGRTEGNRSEEETRILQGAITELRLNYVEEAKKPEPAVGDKVEEPSPPEDAPASEDEPATKGETT
jgi:hypothetical protein